MITRDQRKRIAEAADPETGQSMSLFNPRLQTWSEHFAWTEDSTYIIGKTSSGRATVEALSLNSDLRVRSRAIWVKGVFHPPR